LKTSPGALATVESLPTADPLTRLRLLPGTDGSPRGNRSRRRRLDLSVIEEAFIAVAASYGERKGIGYDAWREVGVEPRVLAPPAFPVGLNSAPAPGFVVRQA
jgi:hypothetical protein